MPAKKLENYTDEELDSYSIEVQNERDTLKETLRGITAERDRRVAEASVQHTLDLMSDAEKAALHQRVQTTGIESKEVVGEPQS